MTPGVIFWGGGSFVSRNYNSIPSALEEGEGRGHGGHLSDGGSFVSRNNSSNCRTGEGGVICVFLSVEPGRRGHLSLGIMILHVEPVICL